MTSTTTNRRAAQQSLAAVDTFLKLLEAGEMPDAQPASISLTVTAGIAVAQVHATLAVADAIEAAPRPVHVLRQEFTDLTPEQIEGLKKHLDAYTAFTDKASA